MAKRKPESPAPTVAALERALAQARAERDEALAQQQAAAEVLGVINSSPGDLAPVFDAMLEKAMRLCEASFGLLMTHDGENFRAMAQRGLPPRFAEYIEENPAAWHGAHRRLAEGAALVHLLDARDDEAYLRVPSRRALVDLGGARTLLLVPLRQDERLLGSFAIYRQQVRAFTNKQIILLQNFAAQAVIAMENARLITETREALERQTATAEVLGVINASPGDLAPVFDAMLEKATRLCEAHSGWLWTYDGERYKTAATRGLPAPFEEFLREPRVPGADTGIARLARGEPLVHFVDLAQVEAYAAGDPLYQASVDLGGFRTILIVPLRKDDALLGGFTIDRQEVRPFSDKQIVLLQNFAAQAVIAMENARLITETQEALEQQTATAEVLGIINSSPGDLAPVFEAILEKAMRLCEASLGHFMEYDGERFATSGFRGASPAFTEFMSQPLAPDQTGGSLGALVRGERFVHVADLMDSDSYRSGNPARRALVDLGGGRTGLWVGLRSEAALVGALVLYRPEARPFSQKQIVLAENFAAQAVIAMKNARLLGELRTRTGDLEESLAYQTATSDLLKLISRSTFDLQPILETVVETAARLCKAEKGAIFRLEDGAYRWAAGISNEPEYERMERATPYFPGENSAVGRAALHRRVVQIVDPFADPLYAFKDETRTGRLGTILTVPLLREGEPIGVIGLARERIEAFTDEEIELIATFADQAVIAIENARLLDELRSRTDEIAGWNRELEARVAAQVDELGRVGRLKQFLAPQLAELVVSQGDEAILESHRREIVVVFCDMRGYTGFSETAEPEEVIEVLREYHAALGPLVAQFEGTLDQFSGDGIMVFFNDPLPCPDPAARAVRMAQAMREAAAGLMATWRRRGHQIGFGVGIAQGYATLGQIGFAERVTYTAIGTVCNLAARLCGEAQDGQILISQRVATGVEEFATLEEIGNLALKGLSQAVAVYNVVGAG